MQDVGTNLIDGHCKTGNGVRHLRGVQDVGTNLIDGHFPAARYVTLIPAVQDVGTNLIDGHSSVYCQPAPLPAVQDVGTNLIDGHPPAQSSASAPAPGARRRHQPDRRTLRRGESDGIHHTRCKTSAPT